MNEKKKTINSIFSYNLSCLMEENQKRRMLGFRYKVYDFLRLDQRKNNTEVRAN